MAVTALKINGNRIKFMSVPEPDRLVVEVFLCDEGFIPLSKPAERFLEESRNEETYHRELRKGAVEKGHYIPEESTNPEWNQ